MEAMYDGKPTNDSNGLVFGRQTEKWYGVDYYISPVDEEDVQQWNMSDSEVPLHLPEPNRYIPRSLDLCEDLPEDARVQRIEKPIEPPTLLVSRPGGKYNYNRWDISCSKMLYF